LPRLLGEGRIITMARRRHTPEQIVRKLPEADRLLGERADVAEVCRQLQVSEATYHRWRAQFGGMKADDAKRLKELEKENQRLKRIVADKELEIDSLREIARDAPIDQVGVASAPKSLRRAWKTSGAR
jgi:putative transposase